MLFPDSDSSFSRLELNSTLRSLWRAKRVERSLAAVSNSHFQSSMENQKFSRRKISSRYRREFPQGWRIATGRWRLPLLGRKSVYNYSDNFYRLFPLGMDLHCLLCIEKCRILIVPFSWSYRYLLFTLRDKWKAVFPPPNFYCFNFCQDVDHVIFGGLLSEPPKVTDSFCGKSNSVLKNLEFKIL